jgi:DNA-binding NtrC family response regulator
MTDHLEQEKKQEITITTDKAGIVIIDDDLSFSLMLKEYLLEHAELQSDCFSSGEDFLKVYSSKDDRIIILDYDLGKGLNGLEVLQKIKSIHPVSAVIIVSSQDDLEKAIDTIRKGATDYFLKSNKTVFANIHCSLMKIFEMERNKLN